MKLLFFVFSFLAVLSGFNQMTEKMKGISFVASSKPIVSEDVTPIVAVNANWVTIMPYGFVGENGRVQYNSKWQWWGETSVGVEETIMLCQQKNLKIMLKPQIWMANAYTGDYNLTNEKDWLTFEESYAEFITTFAKIAEKTNVELFCIGTEWREFIAKRKKFWNSFIDSIKDSFSGKLTYAANWDDYAAVPFWDKMDYIGVNGYFPISYSKKPVLKELVAGWNVHKPLLASFSKKKDKKIIFTEIGYRSIDGATIKPWEHGNSARFNAGIQRDAFKALFTTLWDEDWFEGVFIWKWYHNHKTQGGSGDIDFTPQNKPAEIYISNFWKEN